MKGPTLPELVPVCMHVKKMAGVGSTAYLLSSPGHTNFAVATAIDVLCGALSTQQACMDACASCAHPPTMCVCANNLACNQWLLTVTCCVHCGPLRAGEQAHFCLDWQLQLLQLLHLGLNLLFVRQCDSVRGGASAAGGLAPLTTHARYDTALAPQCDKPFTNRQTVA